MADPSGVRSHDGLWRLRRGRTGRHYTKSCVGGRTASAQRVVLHFLVYTSFQLARLVSDGPLLLWLPGTNDEFGCRSRANLASSSAAASRSSSDTISTALCM